ncbi:hypothetical protein [Amycolatopsis azurea]|uniref:Uncharacterized protein n=1 Tax=Amycolatopsis azurea DSM 43854 TaxID=1238180 RepID=M2PSM7_9PSEU|nr:hypothetical protein [Amycolatopsis azurea]EMD27583.1 hypothetical protein C791_1879 [Amycolatopsis azurea DSM 43854]
MLKVHFTEDDLRLVTVSAVAEPMWELLASLYRLGGGIAAVRFRPNE